MKIDYKVDSEGKEKLKIVLTENDPSWDKVLARMLAFKKPSDIIESYNKKQQEIKKKNCLTY